MNALLFFFGNTCIKRKIELYYREHIFLLGVVMNHQQLKERALCIAKPPKNFQLMFEEVDAQLSDGTVITFQD